MDAFLGCNHIQLFEENEIKTMFIIDQGTHYYKK